MRLKQLLIQLDNTSAGNNSRTFRFEVVLGKVQFSYYESNLSGDNVELTGIPISVMVAAGKLSIAEQMKLERILNILAVESLCSHA